MSNSQDRVPGGPHPAAVPFIIFTLAWLLISYSAVFFLDIQNIIRLTREDGVIEYLGAALFFMASVTYFLLYKRSRVARVFDKIPFRGNIFFLLLGLVFMLGCLEEISWGQRIIGFQTPEEIRDINAQNEFNLHNLQVFHGTTESGERKSFWALFLTIGRMFSMFWFSFCCLVPVLHRYSPQFRSFLNRIQLPIAPMFLAAVFFLNYAISKGIELAIASDAHHSLVEIKESNIAMLFFVMAIWFIRTANYRRNSGVVPPEINRSHK